MQYKVAVTIRMNSRLNKMKLNRLFYNFVTIVTSLECNQNDGIVHTESVTDPAHFNTSDLGDQNNVTCLFDELECYTLVLADNDGDVVLQNGCHNPVLQFDDGCICTTNGGYYCWNKCIESNCNSVVNLHADMSMLCTMETVQNEAPGCLPFIGLFLVFIII